MRIGLLCLALLFSGCALFRGPDYPPSSYGPWQVTTADDGAVTVQRERALCSRCQPGDAPLLFEGDVCYPLPADKDLVRIIHRGDRYHLCSIIHPADGTTLWDSMQLGAVDSERGWPLRRFLQQGVQPVYQHDPLSLEALRASFGADYRRKLRYRFNFDGFAAAWGKLNRH